MHTSHQLIPCITIKYTAGQCCSVCVRQQNNVSKLGHYVSVLRLPNFLHPRSTRDRGTLYILLYTISHWGSKLYQPVNGSEVDPMRKVNIIPPKTYFSTKDTRSTTIPCPYTISPSRRNLERGVAIERPDKSLRKKGRHIHQSRSWQTFLFLPLTTFLTFTQTKTKTFMRLANSHPNLSNSIVETKKIKNQNIGKFI